MKCSIFCFLRQLSLNISGLNYLSNILGWSVVHKMFLKEYPDSNLSTKQAAHILNNKHPTINLNKTIETVKETNILHSDLVWRMELLIKL